MLTFPFSPVPMKKSAPIDVNRIESLLVDIFEGDIHAKRINSLANATLGVMKSSSLAIKAIGNGLAAGRGLSPKHAVKQVDRLLSNSKLDVDKLFEYWVPYSIGQRTEILVAMDWTEFDADDHSTLAINLLTTQGRATPLLWKTVVKSTLKGRQVAHEKALLKRLAETLPEGVKVTVVADRGFGSIERYAYIQETLGMDYIIRFKQNITVTDSKGKVGQAKDWIGRRGQARCLRKAKLTQKNYEVATVICVQQKGMKNAWCIACSSETISTKEVQRYYNKRWGIETFFRDIKDIRYGMGLSYLRISNELRRDRLLLICAFSTVLLTLLGAASEAAGLDKMLKANTVTTRTHSLFHQGCLFYDLIPTLREDRLIKLLNEFDRLLLQYGWFQNIFEVV